MKLLIFFLLSVCFARQKSSKTRAELTKEFGVDPDVRKARLQGLSENAVTIESRFGELPKLPEIPKVRIDEPIGNTPSGIFEFNEKEGIAEYLYQGDMILTKEQINHLERQSEGNGRTKRQADTFYKKWTDNTVYFYFNDNINQEKRDAVHAAHQYLQSHTCINFVENMTATNRVKVDNGAGCFAWVGMQGGEQVLSLGCDVRVPVAAHEFIHALGFQHEHARSDRDRYLTLNDTNIPTDKKHNFKKVWPIDDINYTPYEYGSVMQYTANAASRDHDYPTMIPKDMRYLYTMGHPEVTFYDIQMINDYYGCNANCDAQKAAKCQNGGVPNPRDCSKCNCPGGYGGDVCDKRPSGCGETLTATSEWQGAVLQVGDYNSSGAKIDYDRCTSWITAPQGKTIEVKINNMVGNQCDYGCINNGIEVKGDSETRKTNPVFCCTEFANTVITSSLNPTPVRVYNNFNMARYFFLYRYVDFIPPTTTEAPVTEELGCEDEMPEACATWLKSGRTCEQLIGTSAYRWCGKTCGFCKRVPTTTLKTTTTEAPCEDKQPENCARLKANGVTCEQLQASMFAGYCDKTCGLCGGVSTTTVAPTTTQKPCEDQKPSECSTFSQKYGCDKLLPAVAQQTCAKSCEQCGAPKPTAPCVDKDSNYCSRFIKNGNCDAVPFGVAATICPKSCGYCE